jgi:hypothetical protein
MSIPTAILRAHSCRSAKRRAWTSRSARLAMSAAVQCLGHCDAAMLKTSERATAKSLREEGSRDHPLKVRAGALA